MMPHNNVIKKYPRKYTLQNQQKINHFMYMGDIKIFVKSRKGLEILI